MKNATFERARTFIYRNARPLDLARFQYHFEGGSKRAVLRALACYQNADGGFGHALEADCWNINSTPLHASTACAILQQIDWEDAGHPLIRGLMRWCAGGEHFNGEHWQIVVPSNNLYPHAPWWQAESTSSCHTDYNGTAQLAGFLVRYAPRDSEPYRLGIRIAGAACAALSGEGLSDMHTCACCLHMAELLELAGAQGAIPFAALEEQLHRAVHRLIVTDTARWGGYVCRPSAFIRSRESAYYPENREAAEAECGYIIDTQLEDGSWEINWDWEGYPEAWAISKNWWRSHKIIENLLYLKGFGRLSGAFGREDHQEGKL